MAFGTRLAQSDAFAQLDLFTDMGGTMIDTADMYAYWLNTAPGNRGTGGCAERVIGAWLKQERVRERVFLASKVGNPTSDEEETSGSYGLESRRIIAACEGSLRRLGIETIDLYYAHLDDRKTPLEEVLEAFHRLVKAGKIRYVGASNWTCWRLAEARCLADAAGFQRFCCVQQKHSYLQPRPHQDLDGFQLVTDELVDFCRTYSVALVGHEPLLKGTYLRPTERLSDMRYDYETVDNRARMNVLETVSEEVGRSVIQVVLAWMIRCDPPVIPLVAADDTTQLTEDLNAAEIVLSRGQMDRLTEAIAQTDYAGAV